MNAQITLEMPDVALENCENSEEVGEERLAQDKVRVERDSGSTRLPLFSRGRSSQSRWIRGTDLSWACHCQWLGARSFGTAL